MPEKIKKNLLGRTVKTSSGETSSGTKYKSREVSGPRVQKTSFKEYRKGEDKPFLTEKRKVTPGRSVSVNRDLANPRKVFNYDSASDKKTRVVSTPSMTRRKTVTKSEGGKRLVEKTMSSRKADVNSLTKSIRISAGKGRTKGGRAYQVESYSPAKDETTKYKFNNPVSQRLKFSSEVRKNKPNKK
jgi:hypothetical protein